jgi:hypothetical protein
MRFILAFLSVLMGISYVLLADWYPDVAWLHKSLMHFVWPVSIASISFLLSLFGGRLLARDAVLSAWGAAGLGGCLLLMPLILAREVQSNVDLAERLQLEQTRKELRLELSRLAQIEEEKRKADQADREKRGKTDRFVQYEGRIPDATLATLRDLDERMRAEVDAFAEAYAKALKVNPTKGPESWIRFRTIDQLEIELSAHKALYEQTRAFTQYIESFETSYMGAIEALGLQPPADRIAIAEMERILQFWDRARIYDLRQLDVRLLGSAIAALNVLRDAWGTWAFNPREKRVAFDNPAQEAAFYENIRLVQAIAIEVDSIREEVDAEASPDQ